MKKMRRFRSQPIAKIKYALTIVTIFLLVSCSTRKPATSPVGCNENPEFREAFLSAVQFIDDEHTGEYQLTPTNEELKKMSVEEMEEFDRESAEISKQAWSFVRQYAIVSWWKRSSYDGGYPEPTYQQDRAGWLKWYEDNKCNNIQIKKNWCNENLEFKEKFFKYIRYIEEYSRGHVGEELHKEAVEFISQYTPVSWEKLVKYNPRIPYIVFLKDKENWLLWYESNKCNYIEFK